MLPFWQFTIFSEEIFRHDFFKSREQNNKEKNQEKGEDSGRRTIKLKLKLNPILYIGLKLGTGTEKVKATDFNDELTCIMPANNHVV